MQEIHPNKKWEVSIMKVQEDNQMIFKVTRRIPEPPITETKIFDSKEKAKIQFEERLC